MKRFFHALVVAAAVLASCTKPSPPPPVAQPADDLRPTHQALFDFFLPPDRVASIPGLPPAAASLRSRAWDTLSRDAATADALRQLQLAGFDRLAAADRAAFWNRLATGTETQQKLAQGLRFRYLNVIYASPVGLAIAGVPANAVTILSPNAGDMTVALRRRMPASALRFDARAGEIRDTRGEIDTLIIGSGPAGSVLAHALRAAGQRVVLLDRGPFIVPGAINARGIPALLEAGGSRYSSDGGIRFNNGQAVGGGTTVNIDLAFSPQLPAVRERRDAWRAAGLLGPAFSEDRLAAADAWVREHIGTRAIPPQEINANNRILWDGAAAHGHAPALYALNTRPPEAAEPGDVTTKRSAVDGLLMEALCTADNPLALLSETKAVRLVFDGGPLSGTSMASPDRRAIGVEIESQPATRLDIDAGILHDPAGLALPPGTHALLRAKRVILAAGALGSPAILLNSGITNDAIGRGVIGHPSMPVIGMFDHDIRVLEGTSSSVYVGDYGRERGFMLESTSAQPAYLALMTPADGGRVFDAVRGFQKLGGFGVMLIDTPDAANRIRLNERGEAVIDYHLSDADRARFRFAVAEAVRIMFLGGAKRVLLPTTEDVLGDGGGRPLLLADIGQADRVERSLQFTPGQTQITSAHLQGSCKMGPSPEGSVVDLNLKVWGTQNVYIMDASIFPGSVGANPMQTIYAFAKVFADGLNQRP